jgi:hypothetical protein
MSPNVQPMQPELYIGLNRRFVRLGRDGHINPRWLPRSNALRLQTELIHQVARLRIYALEESNLLVMANEMRESIERSARVLTEMELALTVGDLVESREEAHAAALNGVRGNKYDRLRATEE